MQIGKRGLHAKEDSTQLTDLNVRNKKVFNLFNEVSHPIDKMFLSENLTILLMIIFW